MASGYTDYTVPTLLWEAYETCGQNTERLVVKQVINAAFVVKG
jgi:hypothetical protein